MSALGAVLTRDLRGAERAGLLAWSRALALVGSGLVVLGGYRDFGSGASQDAPHAFAVLVGAVMVLCLVFAASFALGAFRREREAGTLDLLLLSGLRPRTLALGRSLSCFLVLQSIAAAALPALLLFWFFRTPSPQAWLLHLIAVSCWNAAIAAGAVSLSVWSRRPGTAIAAGLIGLPAFAALSLTEGARSGWSAPGLVQQTYLSGGDLDLSRAFFCIGAHAAFVAAAVLVSGFGLEQQRPDAALGEARVSKRRRHPSERRPLTWLLHRSSPAARPGAQALGLSLGLVLLAIGSFAAPLLGGSPADILHPKALSVIGGVIAALALCAALAAGATRIAAERERRTWESIAASARSSERLFSDLIESTLLCCLMPFLLGTFLLVFAELRRGIPLHDALLPVASVLASFVLATVLGLAASACTRGSATALALACVLGLGVPALVAGSQILGAGGGSSGGGGIFLLFLLVLGLPILIRGFGPLLLLAIAAWREGARDAKGPGSLITRPLLVLLPLALLTGTSLGASDQAWVLAYGGAHTALIHVATLGEERSLLHPQFLLSGALWQLLFALLMLHGLWRWRDLWLGRAAT